MARKPKTTVDDKDLLVSELKKRYHSHDLFGENHEWENAYIQDNLKDKLRPYQKETLVFFHDTQRSPKSDINFRHLLFNMATGAGKTMIMAALILYFFKEKNYQNFLFFVHTDGILQKTIDNLINNGVSKYLFTPTIEIDGKAIRIEKVDVFPKIPSSNTIYIKMATIGKIHADLNTVRENGISYEDLKETPLVMLADEAHHYNALTMSAKSDKEKASAWEKTIQRIFNSHDKNRLMEFTATVDLTNQELYDKYKDKIVQRYDLKKFMEDGYSKKVMLLQIDQDDRTKMLDAVLLSQYRKLIAIKNGILGFKPVILFKSNTIATSLAKHEDFNNLIANLSIKEIQNHIQDKQRLLKGKQTSVWHKVAAFYQQTDLQDVLTGIKHDFEPLKIFNANSNEMLDENNAKILNTLENSDNFFRVVFAVAKLSEGWDVLNLFDIVRMSEKAVATKNATNQEAQLIGRGARYFPFTYNNEKSTQRRFDGKNTELAILEQLHYHTINETSYIDNLSNSLTQASLITSNDGCERILSAKVKDGFKKTKLYQAGKLYLNRVKKIDTTQRTLENYSDKEIVLTYKISDENTLTEIKGVSSTPKTFDGDIKFEHLKLNKAYFQKAIQRLKFYQFDNLVKYFPSLVSIDDFIQNQLNKISIKVYMSASMILDELPPKERLYLLELALIKIADNVRRNHTKALGTKTFYGEFINELIKDYEVRIDDSLQFTQNITEKNMVGKLWFVYDKALLNQLEHKMVEDIESIISKLKQKYQDVYLWRNDEKSSGFKLVEFDGTKGFMPDFILMLVKENENLFYQVMLEPKGEPYYMQDRWKENLLESINTENVVIEENENVRLVGVRFYRQFNDGETDFTQEFFDDLSKKIYDGEALFKARTALQNGQQDLF